jgi:lipopolysaccharide/colanic/teichoic acid biosynthesis glycosyltransferase
MDAFVPSSSLPVLTRCAGCKPVRRGEDAGGFVFRSAALAQTTPCGVFERLTAVLLLLALLPLLAVVSAILYLFEGAPVLFRQTRYGREGQPFTLLKFRTMVHQSERLQATLQRELGTKGRLFKLERDPRVTRIGRFLRHTFLDELPQLVNVARGEMRFIGPRPLPACDHGHYTQRFHGLRLKGMPGMTGLWQVAGRNERTFDEMCLLDVYYLCNRSAVLDLKIIGRTIGMMFKQVGLKSEAECGSQQPVDIEEAGKGGQHQGQAPVAGHTDGGAGE